jgi:hypothetical protein
VQLRELVTCYAWWTANSKLTSQPRTQTFGSQQGRDNFVRVSGQAIQTDHDETGPVAFQIRKQAAGKAVVDRRFVIQTHHRDAAAMSDNVDQVSAVSV